MTIIPPLKEISETFSCEKIAYWFFRLNGCLNLTNFLVHHERKGKEGTEIDVLGVRFPNRNELALSGFIMDDHPMFTGREKKIDIIIADATKGPCKVNTSWANPEKKNMQRILYAIGVFPKDKVEAVATAMYDAQLYEDKYFRCNIFALGNEENINLPPNVIQLTWEAVLSFIHYRFNKFEDYKLQYSQWESFGQRLIYKAFYFRHQEDKFIKEIIINLSA